MEHGCTRVKEALARAGRLMDEAMEVTVEAEQ